MKGVRLDMYLVDRGLAPSRERAQSLIMAGNVRVSGRPATKAGQLVAEDADVEVIGEDHPYVGRGGIKLAHAIAQFGVRVANSVCLDAGASTGGFTDCLLQHGAARVYAIDVGRGQLAWKLRQDTRVVIMEKINVRYLKAGDIPEKVGLATLDLSFISLAKVFHAVDIILKDGANVISLIKPQFEVGKGRVGRGGIVRDEGMRQEAIATVKDAAFAIGWCCKGVIPSPITGADGNVEYLAHFVKT